MIVPFLSTLSKHSLKSTIDDKYSTNMFMMDMLRKSLYIDANAKKLSLDVKSKIKSLDITPMINLYADSNKIILDSLDKAVKV